MPKSKLTTTDEYELNAMIELINGAHSRCSRAFETALESAREAGVLLLKVKAKLGHGEWLPWLENNFEGTPRQAQKYMRLTENWDQILQANANSGSHLSINGALSLIAETVADEESEVVDAEIVDAEVNLESAGYTWIQGSDGEPYMPGSGDEGIFFMADWCNKCALESDCKILTMSLIGKQPSEWIFKSDKPMCTAFEAIPPKCAPLSNPNAHDEHWTPTHIVELVKSCLGPIDLDPCSNQGDPNIPAIVHLTRDRDGLSKPWFGKVYMNPPYSKGETSIEDWIDKLLAEYGDSNVSEAIALVPAYSDTKWWQKLRDWPVCMIHGRLTFLGNTGPARFPSALFYLGEDIGKFYCTFRTIGTIYQRVHPGTFGD
jgi:hypothetical protein